MAEHYNVKCIIKERKITLRMNDTCTCTSSIHVRLCKECFKFYITRTTSFLVYLIITGLYQIEFLYFKFYSGFLHH